MMSIFFAGTDLKSFDLDASNIIEFNERTIVVKKWNWEYSKAHAFQRHCLELLNTVAQLRILICCNHPRVLTHGRGLQKARKGEVLSLVDFDPSQFPTLPFPLFNIERGGGLTFHHPGQFIFYPIVRLNPKTLSLSTMIDSIFEAAISVLKDWGLEGANHENKLLGIWWKDQKIASMGIAIERLTTFHGMALNLYRDEEMKSAMRILNPCGLHADTYTSVEELIDIKNHGLEEFTYSFLQKISTYWT